MYDETCCQKLNNYIVVLAHIHIKASTLAVAGKMPEP
uniref:Uncharacterized protein n=1 Tax=Anguilla anguilla TaxID=7936 RepID=A0A0E9XCW4_ANGAN